MHSLVSQGIASTLVAARVWLVLELRLASRRLLAKCPLPLMYQDRPRKETNHDFWFHWAEQKHLQSIVGHEEAALSAEAVCQFLAPY